MGRWECKNRAINMGAPMCDRMWAPSTEANRLKENLTVFVIAESRLLPMNFYLRDHTHHWIEVFAIFTFRLIVFFIGLMTSVRQ